MLGWFEGDLPMALVEGLYNDHEAILGHLRTSEPSFHGYLERSLPKVLLLAAASEFEYRLTGHLKEFFAEVTDQNLCAMQFLETKGISRQYHTFFRWDELSAAPFFSLFGYRFRTAARARQKSDERFGQAVQDFLQLGALRNQLVHGNYATFTLDKTSSELFAMYQSAQYFVEELPSMLRKYGNAEDGSEVADQPTDE
jgi:hypothetical protein